MAVLDFPYRCKAAKAEKGDDDFQGSPPLVRERNFPRFRKSPVDRAPPIAAFACPGGAAVRRSRTSVVKAETGAVLRAPKREEAR